MPKHNRGGRKGQHTGWSRPQEFRQLENPRGSVYSRLGNRPTDQQDLAPVDARQVLIARRQMSHQEDDYYRAEHDMPPVGRFRTHHGRRQNIDMEQGFEPTDFPMFDTSTAASPMDIFQLEPNDGYEDMQPVSGGIISHDDVRNTVLNRKRPFEQIPGDLRAYLKRKQQQDPQPRRPRYMDEAEGPPSFKITLHPSEEASNWHQQAPVSPQQSQPRVRSTASFFQQMLSPYHSPPPSSTRQSQVSYGKKPQLTGTNRDPPTDITVTSSQIISPKPKAYIQHTSTNLSPSHGRAGSFSTDTNYFTKDNQKKKSLDDEDRKTAVRPKSSEVGNEVQPTVKTSQPKIPSAKEKYSPVSRSLSRHTPSQSPLPAVQSPAELGKELPLRNCRESELNSRIEPRSPDRSQARSPSPFRERRAAVVRKPDISRLRAKTLGNERKQSTQRRRSPSFARHSPPRQERKGRMDRDREDMRPNNGQNKNSWNEDRNGRSRGRISPEPRRRKLSSSPVHHVQRTPERRTERRRMDDGRQLRRRSPSFTRKQSPQRNDSQNGRCRREVSPSSRCNNIAREVRRSLVRNRSSNRDVRPSKQWVESKEVQRRRCTDRKRVEEMRKSPSPKRQRGRKYTPERMSRSRSHFCDNGKSEIAEGSTVDSEEDRSVSSDEEVEREAREGSTITSSDAASIEQNIPKRNGRLNRSVTPEQRQTSKEVLELEEKSKRKAEEEEYRRRPERSQPIMRSRSPERPNISRRRDESERNSRDERNRQDYRQYDRFDHRDGAQSRRAQDPPRQRSPFDPRRSNGGKMADKYADDCVKTFDSPVAEPCDSSKYPSMYDMPGFAGTTALEEGGDALVEEEEEVLDLTVHRNGRSEGSTASGSLRILTGNHVALRPLLFGQKTIASSPENLMVRRDVSVKVEEKNGNAGGEIMLTGKSSGPKLPAGVSVERVAQSEEERLSAMRNAQRHARVKLSSEKIEEVSSRVCAARQGRVEQATTSQGRATAVSGGDKAITSAATSPVRAMFKTHSSGENSPSKSTASSGNVVIDGRHPTPLAWVLPPSVRIGCDYRVLVKGQFPEDARQEDPRWILRRGGRERPASGRESDKDEEEGRKERRGSDGKPKKSEDKAA